MKKILEQQVNESITRTKIFYDDMEEILLLMNQKGFNTIISDQENIYDSLEELQETKGDHPVKIEISVKFQESTFHRLSITLKSGFVNIYAIGDPNLLALAYEIEKLVQKKKVQWYYSILNAQFAKNYLLISVLLYSILIPYALYNGMQFDFKKPITYLSIGFLILVYSELNPKCNLKIDLNRQHKAKFLIRNKDKILLSATSAIIGSIITLLISYLIK